MITVHMGDNLPWLQSLPDDSIDSLVTDPPYGLSKPPPIEVLLRAWLGGDKYEHDAAGFMGRKWDSMVPSPTTWREAFRVMKPGAYGVVFAGQRTVDLMGISLRLAGFEVRDCCGWSYFNGFPKSMNVSKALDKMAGAEREVVGPKVYPDGTVGHFSDSGVYGAVVDGAKKSVTAPATPEAQQWDGFGTALKPCIEPFLLIRKPLAEKTIARQVLATGTGALNIDGCRYPLGDKAWPGPQENYGRSAAKADGSMSTSGKVYGAGKGISGHNCVGLAEELYANTGGRFPSNYYHCPKASTKERERGCDSLPEVAGHDIVSRKEGSAGLDNPRAGAGRKAKSRKNSHNTIKPVRLMRWLCRLLTPPGGTVLEPFMGSGTTGVAASLEGFDCLSAEFTPEYHAIAEARIGHAIAHPDEWADTTPGDWSHRAKSGGKS
jgi:site-specific DNA-methyltransferase (adenine-specific)